MQKKKPNVNANPKEDAGRLVYRRPVFCSMKCKFIGLIGIFFALMAWWFFTRPCFFISADDAVLFAFPANEGETVSIRFIHSVQKTAVLENLHLELGQNSFVLDSTKYQSFGVGLPFLAQEGEFRREGDYFIMDHMKRKFPSVELRTGIGTKLTLLFRGKEYPVYEDLPIGSRVKLSIAPYYKWFSVVQK